MSASPDPPAPFDATLLVVDDDPVTRVVVSRGLQDRGYRNVLVAESGEAAQAVLAEHAVDLVVTDLLMPGIDGLQLIRWAREHQPGPDWIILSGVDTFDAAVEAIHVGAFDFLSKPPRLQELGVAVRNALEHRRLVRERSRLLADLAATNGRLADKVRELEDASERIRRDLERAEVIQRALLPAEPPALNGHRITALYRPGRHVGGDLYHVARVGPRHLVVCVADATGHGVSSAMLSVLFHRRLLAAQQVGTPMAPSRVLEHVNRALCQDRVVAGLFLTAAYCLLDLETDEVTVAGAGHPPVLLHSRDGACRRIRRTGPVLGLTPRARYSDEAIRLRPGDRLLLFTDGLLHGGEGTGALERLEKALSGAREGGNELLQDLVEALEGPAAGQAESVPTSVEGRSETMQAPGDGANGDGDRDDLTVLMLEVAPGPSHFDNRPGGPAPGGGGTGSAPSPGGDPVLWYGERDERAFLQVRGRGTWLRCDPFHETVQALLEAGRTVVVDLGPCPYLDSTFLGTLHELASAADRARGGAFVLQAVQPQVREAFDELGLDRVQAAVQAAPLPLPDELAPLHGDPAPSGSRLRVLRAHEALASLSARNREKFLAVVEAIRGQLEGPSTG